MRGLPARFGTKADVGACLAVDPAGTKAMLERLLTGRMSWVAVAPLGDGDPGVSDETHQVRVEPVDPDADPLDPDAPRHRVQYELREDPGAELFRIGLTVQEAEDHIAACKRSRREQT